jgi:ornithine carbamoyltransferase
MNIPKNMSGRSLLTLYDLRDEEMLALIDFAIELKAAKKAGKQRRLLDGMNLAAVFEKSSTRTRCATAVAGYDEGAHVEYLGKNDIHLGKKESVADTARVLGRMFDGILFRGFAHRTVELLAEHAGVPVWNGLTDDAHPTQVLADLMTVKERFGTLQGLKMAFVGDGRNNVCNSLMLGCAKAGMDFVNCCPPELSPSQVWVDRAQNAASRTGCSIQINHDPVSAVRGANVIYTDVWVSMGEEDVFNQRLALLKPYQVDMDMVRRTGQLDDGWLMFLHCLPAFHNNETELTKDLGALEVTDDVFEAEFSCVFEQAENRMHTIKAMMVATLV